MRVPGPQRRHCKATSALRRIRSYPPAPRSPAPRRCNPPRLTPHTQLPTLKRPQPRVLRGQSVPNSLYTACHRQMPRRPALGNHQQPQHCAQQVEQQRSGSILQPHTPPIRDIPVTKYGPEAAAQALDAEAGSVSLGVQVQTPRLVLDLEAVTAPSDSVLDLTAGNRVTNDATNTSRCFGGFGGGRYSYIRPFSWGTGAGGGGG